MYSFGQIEKNIKARLTKGGGNLVIGNDGGMGDLVFKNTEFHFQFSTGEGWEHVSVSTRTRCPTWDEMCFFKDIFWPPNETCVQFHPAQSEYVNLAKYCLHIWRPEQWNTVDGKLLTPPKILTGF